MLLRHFHPLVCTRTHLAHAAKPARVYRPLLLRRRLEAPHSTPALELEPGKRLHRACPDCPDHPEHTIHP